MNKYGIYAALIACLSGGYGAGVAVSPSQNDVAQAIREAHQQDCELSAADRRYLSGKVNNSPAKEF